ncbi:hypothetical protein QYM36_015104, partial [Artemia franciscana]
VVHTHFYVKKNEVIAQCQNWIAEMESYSGSSKAVSSGLTSLKKCFASLKEELEKLPCPSKLKEIIIPEELAPVEPEPVAGPSSLLQKPASPVEKDSTDSLSKKKFKLPVPKYVTNGELDFSELL